jgi:hypothetical protein
MKDKNGSLAYEGGEKGFGDNGGKKKGFYDGEEIEVFGKLLK